VNGTECRRKAASYIRPEISMMGNKVAKKTRNRANKHLEAVDALVSYNADKGNHCTQKLSTSAYMCACANQPKQEDDWLERKVATMGPVGRKGWNKVLEQKTGKDGPEMMNHLQGYENDILH